MGGSEGHLEPNLTIEQLDKNWKFCLAQIYMPPVALTVQFFKYLKDYARTVNNYRAGNFSWYAPTAIIWKYTIKNLKNKKNSHASLQHKYYLFKKNKEFTPCLGLVTRSPTANYTP